MKSPRLSPLLMTIFAINLMPSIAFAADRFWMGTSGDWNNSANWYQGNLPGANDFVYLNSSTLNSTVNYNTSTTHNFLEIASVGSNIITLNHAANSLNLTSLLLGKSTSTYGLYSSGNYNLSGSGSLTANYEDIGRHGGHGSFIQTGGINTVSTLRVGYLFDYYNNTRYSGDGSYLLSDNGVLSAQSEMIGSEGGIGRFTQTGGSNTISGDLYIAGASNNSVVDSRGSYYLSGGSLSTNNEYIGVNNNYGVGEFIQTGGIHTVNGNLYLAANKPSFDFHVTANYTLTNGILNVAGNIASSLGGTPSNSTLNLDGGTLNVNGSISVSKLVLGSTANTVGNFTLTNGKTLQTGQEWLGSEDGGYGTIIQTGGTHTSGSLNITNGNYDLRGGIHDVGTLNVGTWGGNGNYDFNGGSLTTRDAFIGSGGTGTFTQNNANHNADFLFVGFQNSNSNSNYTLISGNLTTEYYEYVGKDGGNATFTQDGGNNSAGVLWIGDGEGSNGNYLLSAGNLTTSSLAVGNGGGVGSFIQNGGSNTTSSLNMGDSTGSYVLNDGELVTDREWIGGSNGSGTFIQNGGIHTINGYIYLGAPDIPNYDTSISVDEENTSTFASQGINLIQGEGQHDGNYFLNGGRFIVNNIFNTDGHLAIGVNGSMEGSAIFTQTDGLTRVDGSMQLSSVAIQGGILQGNGTITAPVTVTGGTIAAGNSIGALTIDGNFTLDGGTLLTEIGGTGNGEFDLLNVTGGINLNSGTLAFSFIDGFTAQAGDEWLFLAGLLTGSLENLIFTYSGIPEGLNFVISSSASGLKLSAVQIQAVPVPAASWLMASSLISMAGLSRRKKAA